MRIATFLAGAAPITSVAQFYPESNPAWCLESAQSPDGFHIVVIMDDDPDTLIQGIGYKVMHTYFDDWGPWLPYGPDNVNFVRSDSDGKGYVYLPDSAAEYLTGDVNALEGDTLHNVLVKADGGDICLSDPILRDVIVDSVRVRTNFGISVIRHYVHTPCYIDNGFDPIKFFWQAGAGTSHGPFLKATGGLNNERVLCITAEDTCYYSSDGGSDGLPGGPICCFPPVTGVGEQIAFGVMRVAPNPSSGLFAILGDSDALIEVKDEMGRSLLTTRGPTIDLLSFSPGCYFAKVHRTPGSYSLRLVVLR